MKKHIALVLALSLLLLSACAGGGETPPAGGSASPDTSVPLADGLADAPDRPAGGAEQVPALSVQPADIPALPSEDEPGGDSHQPAEGDELDAETEAPDCGNTVTKITRGYAGETYSLDGDDSAALTDLLLHLTYDPMGVCRCPVEYTVDTEFGSGYGVNLTESFARCEAGQAPLTAEQVELIQGIIQRNCAPELCGYPLARDMDQ